MNQPLVTVVTPSYNQAAYLTATLESVASQDYQAIEHIVLDGGSTDGSVEILASWNRHAITWRSRPDGGQAAAIAEGFAGARGEIVSWLNSDDVYLAPDVVSTVVARMLETGASVVTGAGQVLEADGTPREPILLDPRWTFEELCCLDTILQPATFFRRELAAACPLDVSLHYVFDWDLFIRMSRIAKFEGLDLPLAGYRLHGAGKSETGGYRRQRELLRVVARYRGPLHPATIGLAVIAASYLLVEHLPRVCRVAHERFVRRIVLLTHWATGGRGIVY